MDLKRLLFVLFVGLSTVTSTRRDPTNEVKHLIGEPDFRDVTLRWEYDTKADEISSEESSPAFEVNCCELQAWGLSRCRSTVVTKPDQLGNEVYEIQTKRKKNRRRRIYSTKISGLRMATTYSFEVHPMKSGRELKTDDSQFIKRIVLPTKGFSARATQCLPHASEVEVSTGPYFGGRIAVEAADGERCAVSGDPTSSRDTYTLRIDHDECGSDVNETTVATYVIVQENLPILTHSTRRFLVLCSYKPETLTVRAGINLPASGSSNNNIRYYRPHSGSIEPYDNVDESMNEVSPPRLEARVADNNSPNMTQKILTVVLIVAGVAGIAFLMWKIIPGTKIDSDTLSISSFGSSFTRNSRKYTDNQSDAGSIYSISLSECGHCGDNSKPSNDDNTSEA